MPASDLALLLYCCTAVLLYCLTVLLFYCFTALLTASGRGGEGAGAAPRPRLSQRDFEDMHAQLLSGLLDARVHEQVCVRYCFTASLLLLCWRCVVLRGGLFDARMREV